MDSSEIETFLQIARHRSLSKTAESVFLAQSTVSKKLQMLEQKLGYTLFERGKGLKTLELTPRGREFVKVAERWQDLAREAREIGREGVAHHLTIGTVSSANMTFIPYLCRGLWEHEPVIRFRTISLHSTEMYEEIEKRNIDVGFSLVEQSNPQVQVVPRFSVEMVGLRLKQEGQNKVVNVRDLDPANCIHFFWGTRYQIWHDYWFRTAESPHATIDNAFILFSLLVHPEQWSIVPRGIASLLLAQGTLETFQIDPAPPDRIFYLLTHKHPKSHIQYPVKVFEQLLREELAGGNSDVYKLLSIQGEGL